MGGTPCAFSRNMPTFNLLKNLALPLLTASLLAGCGAPQLDDPSTEETTDAVNPSAPTLGVQSTMPACGTALAAFDGSTAYSNGTYTGTGTSCAGVGSYGYQYQCVELVMRHFTRKWGLRWYGNAKDLLNNAPRASVDVYNNGDRAHPPLPGDMLVWTNGTYGHVALVTAVRAGAVDIIEQNVTGSGKATLGYDGARIAARWTSWVPAGWAHAKANGGGGISWNCANSAYGGRQYWTCSGGDLYRCDSAGSPQVTRCASGCTVRALGTDDVCK